MLERKFTGCTSWELVTQKCTTWQSRQECPGQSALSTGLSSTKFQRYSLPVGTTVREVPPAGCRLHVCDIHLGALSACPSPEVCRRDLSEWELCGQEPVLVCLPVLHVHCSRVTIFSTHWMFANSQAHTLRDWNNLPSKVTSGTPTVVS